ncbi:WPP domain-interacting tail-anchored protein 2 [Abeliophyllum distichum]|uniref:WPP domain-interacting tail-anchored protein 2 n=1 Tax=Abeliophyllum distichum TaxID=126358 RepID=A0ABD1V5K2_9LAMI
MVEDSEVICERLFEAEYTAEILLGISKELYRRIQIVQFNLDGSVQREGELRSKLQNSESTIKGMENLIEDLKSKVSKAESQTESAKEKCIILPESSSNLREEIKFQRGRIECLEASLRQAKEAKKGSARYHHYERRKIAVKRLQQMYKDPFVTMLLSNDAKGIVKEFMFSENESVKGTSNNGSTEKIIVPLPSGHRL